MRIRIVLVGPDTGFAPHDLVSIFIAFRVEEFQLLAGGLLAGARTVHHPGVEFRDAPLSSYTTNIRSGRDEQGALNLALIPSTRTYIEANNASALTLFVHELFARKPWLS